MKKGFLIIFIFLFSTLAFSWEGAGDILKPDEAFKVEAELQKDAIKTKIDLGDQIYIYDKELHYKITSPKQIDITKDLKLPKPEKFHGFIVHRKSIDVDIPLSLIKEKVGDANKVMIEIDYQGCSEKGLCYAPLKKSFTFDISKALAKSSVEENQKQELPKPSSIKTVEKPKALQESLANENLNTNGANEQDKIAQILKGGNIWLILTTFFGFGLLLSLTPCIFPMIPILSSIIVSQSKESMNAKKGFFLSLIYVLSMALAYTIAGVLAALFGSNLQAAMQNPWVVVIFSLVFVALAFSMFGFYEISLPASWQSKLSKKSAEAQEYGIAGIAIMGFLSALIVGPCVAPPLAGALIYIGQTGNVFLGGAALFVMSLGMGVPLLLIGIGAGKYMPKPGVWMTRVSYVFGVVMLGVAIWMLDKILPSQVTLLLWGLLFLGSAVYMGAFDRLEEGVSGWRKLVKTIAIFFAIYATLLIIGAFSKATNPLVPLESFIAKGESASLASSSVKNELSFKKISSLSELEEAVKSAKKPVMIDFSAKWCTSCKEFDEITFKDPRVIEALRGFELYRVDVTKNSDEDKKLLKRFGLFGPPGIVFFKEGRELKDLEVVGFKEPDEFLKYLKKVEES
ncbi:MAG: protein-disulfide reductase DsbD [Epsilonproteobacteria bacterium]|nr:protein-disulfide reductase DsbD [Campylobacterota bacterium]